MKVYLVKNKIKLSLAITAALMSNTVFADSWDLTQTTILETDTELTQTGTTSNGSVQSLNAINMGDTSVIESLTNQTSEMDALTLKLTQSGSTEASTQTANYAKAASIGDASGTVTQEHIGVGNITLNQTTSGTANTQAVNAAEATTTIANLTQEVNTTETVTLEQSATGANNIQAVNAASGAVINLSQEVSPTVALDMNQAGESSTQAANLLDAAGKDVEVMQQDIIDTPTITLDQTGSGTSVQAGNMVSAANIDDMQQSIDGDSIDLTQGGAAAVGDSSVQAGNYLVTTGDVALASQILGDGVDDVIRLDQNKSGLGTIQAGNLLDASDVGAIIGDGTQAVIADSLTMTQDDTTTALQAGNAVLTGGDGSVIQEITVGSLNMTQTSASGSFQVANYAGVKPQ